MNLYSRIKKFNEALILMKHEKEKTQNDREASFQTFIIPLDLFGCLKEKNMNGKIINIAKC